MRKTGSRFSREPMRPSKNRAGRFDAIKTPDALGSPETSTDSGPDAALRQFRHAGPWLAPHPGSGRGRRAGRAERAAILYPARTVFHPADPGVVARRGRTGAWLAPYLWFRLCHRLLVRARLFHCRHPLDRLCLFCRGRLDTGAGPVGRPVSGGASGPVLGLWHSAGASAVVRERLSHRGARCRARPGRIRPRAPVHRLSLRSFGLRA